MQNTTPKPDAASRRADDPPGSDSDFIRGTYRRLGELNAKFDRFFALVSKALDIEESDGDGASQPRQPSLPGMPESDWSEPVLTTPPRVWSNTVKIYDILWKNYGTHPFTLPDMIRDCADTILCAIRFGRKVSVSTYPRVLSALVKAGAATQSKSVYTLTEPSDDLRDLVERTRAKKQQPAA